MDNNIIKYQYYTINDFIWDVDFRRWVLQPGQESYAFWEGWLELHPEKKEIVDAARQIILSIHLKEEDPEVEEMEQMITQVLSQDVFSKADHLKTVDDVHCTSDSDTHLLQPIKRVMPFAWLIRAAAIFILVTAGAAVFYFNKTGNEMEHIASSFGSMKTVRLPDHSTIMLNGNSKISFRKQWRKNSPRELWLEGEGFFDVSHIDVDQKIEENERFLVHLKEVTVEVLGTSFNIRERRNKTEIVLKTGKIQLSFRDKNRPAMIMKPGQIVSVSPGTSDYIKDSTIQAEDYIAWTHKKLVLNQETLSEIIQYLEDNYGKKIVVQDTSLFQRKYQGTILLDNLEDALFVLSKVLDVHILTRGNNIYFIPN